VLSFRVDVSRPDEVEGLFRDVSKTTPSIHAVVNNAAVGLGRPMAEISLEDWQDVMDSNLRAAFLVVRGALPSLRAAQGAIVNVASVHAVATSVNITAYAASKGGLVALTRAMAVELAPLGVRANAVLPGAVDTPMLREGLARGHLGGGTVESRLHELEQRTVLGRIGRPEEIAQAILFLADGNRSSFITGQTLVVDGGATARLSTE
jgi:NAD(P)-dependent dehydrogenase (short-subunit alcohol dehydrogenase family)